MGIDIGASVVDLVALGGFVFFVVLTLVLRRLDGVSSAEFGYYGALCFFLALCVCIFDQVIHANSTMGYFGIDAFKLESSRLKHTLMITFHVKYALMGLGLLHGIRGLKRCVFGEPASAPEVSAHSATNEKLG